MANLLVHSLHELREVIFAVLDAAAPRHVIEIGSESGNFTAELVEWVRAHGAGLTTIDPAPAAAVDELAAKSADVHRLLRAKSPGALADAPDAQAYVIDGDHNYWVVSGELLHVQARSTRTGEPAVVILHDVGWPAGRRDLYYAPGDLPTEHIHPHTFERGVHLDSAETVDGGFRGEGIYAAALHEGGPRNGVLTAIEDFMSAHPGWELRVIPAVFGLGVLLPTTHPRRDAILAALQGYADNPVLARLEENRLRNYLEVIALQDREASVVATRDVAVAERDALRAELAASHAAREAVERERDAKAAAGEALEKEIAALKARWYARLGGRIDRQLGQLPRSGRRRPTDDK